MVKFSILHEAVNSILAHTAHHPSVLLHFHN